jgi:uncharacterized cupredoxin-like copper-binding protein
MRLQLFAVPVMVVVAAAWGPTSRPFAFASSQLAHPAATARASRSAEPTVVQAQLSEWKITLTTDSVASGPTTFQVHNSGTMPHAFEVEAKGIEKRTRPIPPDSSATLTLDLKAGKYEIYCPLGEGSHKKMGMETDLVVRSTK